MDYKEVFSRSASVESLLDELSLKAQLIFDHIDSQGRGYLEPWQLAQACGSEVNKDDFQEVLIQLDADGDGLINFADFYKSFQKIVRRKSFYSCSDDHLTSLVKSRINSTSSTSGKSERSSRGGAFHQDSLEEVYQTANLRKRSSIFQRIRARARKRQLTRQRSASSVSDVIALGRSEIIKCQEEIENLHRRLGRDSSSLQNLFDRIMAEVLSEIHGLRDENTQMERAIDMERRRHMEEIAKLTEELEKEIALAEKRTRVCEREAALRDSRIPPRKKSSCSLWGLDMGHTNKGRELYSRGKLTPEELEVIRHKIFFLRWQKLSAEAEVKELRNHLQSARDEITTLRIRQDASAQELVAHTTAISELLQEKKILAMETSQLKEMNKRLSGITNDLVAAIETNTPVSVTSNPYLPTSVSCTSLFDSYVNDDDDFSRTFSYESGAKQFSHKFACTDSGRWSPRCQSEISCAESFPVSPVNECPVTIVNPIQSNENNPMPKETVDGIGSIQAGGLLHLNRQALPSRKQTLWGQSFTESIRRSISRSRKGSSSSRNSLDMGHCADAERVSVYKVMLAGDSAVGKTSLVLRLCKDRFDDTTSPSIGVDIMSKEIDLDNERTVLQLWDTAGQERFQSVSASFFRKADAVLLLYACDRKETFIDVRYWMKIIQDARNPRMPVILVASKADLKTDICGTSVAFEQGKQLAKEFKSDFIEVSARSGANVDICAHKLLRDCARKDVVAGVVKLGENVANQRERTTCCGV